MLTLTGATIDFDTAAIHLLDAERGELFVAATRAQHGHTVAPDVQNLRVPLGEGFSGLVASTGEAVLSSGVAAETSQAPLHRDVPGDETIRSYLGVPLHAGPEVIGVLELASHTPGFFTEEHLALARILARQAALAIENARLYAGAKGRSEGVARLNEALRLLSAHRRRDPLLEEIARQCVLVAGVTRATLLLPDESGERLAVQATFPFSPSAPPAVPIAGSLAGECFREQQPRSDGPLYLPIVHRGTSRAVLRLETEGDWTELEPERSALLAILREHAGLTLETVRLFQLQRQEADISTSLLQLAGLLSREADPEALLSQLVTLAPRLVEAERCCVVLWEAGEGQFRAGSAYGLPPDEQARFAARRWSLAEAPLLAELRSEHQPILLNGPDAADQARELVGSGLQAVAAFPLLVRRELLGVLAVGYAAGPHGFSSQEIALLSGIADQSAVVIQNALLLAASRRRQSELARLLRAEASARGRLDAVLQSMTEGLIVFNEHARALLINARVYTLHGLDPQQDSLAGLAAEDVDALLAQQLDNGQPAPELAEQLRHGGHAPLEADIVLRRPRRVLRRVIAPIVDEQNSVLGRVVLYHDVTADRDAQRLKDELMSIVSHELRTPLTSILGYAKMLVDKPEAPAEKRARWSHTILDRTRMLARLIEQILDLSRLNTGRLTFHFAPADLGALVRQVCDDLAITTEAHRLVVEVEPELPSVRLDDDRIQQVLANLLSNAIKYSPNGGDIRVQAERRGEAVSVAVVDHGLGIAPEYTSHIFDPFYRVPDARAHNTEGSGLGLAVSRSIVEAHGGRIGFTSRPGQGSSFYFVLPCNGPREGVAS